MKKNFKQALLGAIALTGAMGFTACSSDSDVVETNPNYNSATGEVLTNFVFNVSMGNTATTRLSAAATQATNTQLFRGIDNAIILSDKQSSDGKHIAAPTTMDKIYDMSRIAAAGTLNKDKSRRVLEMALPLNTNTMMFYGKATEGTATSEQAANGLSAYDLFGHLEIAEAGGYNVGVDLNNVYFEVAKRLTTANLSDYGKIQQLLAGMLTCVMNSNLKGDHHVAIVADNNPGTGIPNYGFNVATNEYNEVEWADYNNANATSPAIDGAPLTPLEEKLASAYREMTTIAASDGELRCGSGSALERMLQDLWTVVNEVRCAIPTSKAEAVAKYLAARISSRLGNYMQANVPTNGAPVTNAHLKPAADIISSFAADTSWPTTAGTKPSDFTSINSIQLGNFPHNFKLPAGATHLAFDKTTKMFSYVQNYNSAGMGSQPFTVENYYYSPELLYFGNSPLRVANQEYKTEDYPASVADWDDENSWPNGENQWQKNKHVLSTTRSVAMVNDINYGTALLQTTVGYSATTLKDNNNAIQKSKNADVDEPDKEITVDATTFQLVGVIVGGQPKRVGWDFLPTTTKVGSDDVYVQGYVYDLAIPDPVIPASGVSQPNYTLLFDNYNATTTTTQDKVYVALELKNNSGQDFFGMHNLIREGGTFYLIGELDPTAAGLAAITWPTHHPLPPYNADGTSKETTRVFMQDYMTTANFKIGVNSLKYAYLTVPDLRSSSLTLGLSVDLQWSTGLCFDDVILGGN